MPREYRRGAGPSFTKEPRHFALLCSLQKHWIVSGTSPRQGGSAAGQNWGDVKPLWCPVLITMVRCEEVAKHLVVLEPGNCIPGATAIYIAVSALSFMLARVLCVEIAEGGGARREVLGSIKPLEKGLN